MKKILGYSDKLSVRPGETLSFMVSCSEAERFEASIVRLIHGDVNPAGPGYKEERLATESDGAYPGRKQEILSGSYVVVPHSPLFDQLASFTVQVMAWPTTPGTRRQSLISLWDVATKSGFVLGIDEAGALSLRIGDGSGKVEQVSSGKPMLSREWYLAAASFDAASGTVCLYQQPMAEYGLTDDRAEVSTTTAVKPGRVRGPLMMAGCRGGELKGRIRAADKYNGKLDSPILSNVPLSRLQIEQALAGTLPDRLASAILARWDFAREITTETVVDLSGNRLNGETVNLPARGMKGYNWSGREMSWRHAPEEYGAIHFHDDDLYDSGWDVDFELTVPDSFRSGIYAAHVRTEGGEDYIPFVVRPKHGTRKAKIAFLVPTASYMAYANDHMALDFSVTQLAIGRVIVVSDKDSLLQEHPEYGLSCYDVHSDGSGVCYSSRLRPIVDMRPKVEGALGGTGSSLWQFNADLHITDWLETKGFDFDCITDEDLHYEGLSALSGYNTILTGSHPEYWSKQMWNTLDGYKKLGGRLMYMGGNGWYWRIAYHQTKPGVIEVRRAEDGIRSWEAVPGEYYHSFTGEFGGLWRRQGLPPQMVAGTGFTAQGFDISSYFRRTKESFDPRASFIFEGIGDEELIGDFGLIGGGAAGLELDRADRLLGTPPNALIVAASENHTGVYYVVCDEMLTNRPGLSGPDNPLVRADMVFYETPAGGAVFSTSSIAWSGSLSHNGYDNNVSRITENVLRRFVDDTPF
ncbi:N,N-dimethylformamidase beta subunit family domain-containing protein [Mesorhizobium australicum]|uniref:N,N-dimethylformamidase n=1 Tax=Mesorhizobium australicum TaxID=536018 RepID=A0A1X7MNR1_9HYPH|nr:N,N-dimethylformamidase beta subunit family domain-containing protein [Mesorhizobium australicum]SMH26489.1 N,N-dimethylformamidase [Mesorhizobium australicum]